MVSKSNLTTKCVRNTFSIIFVNFRLKKVSTGLVAAGHNVTVVSPGADVSSENLHYIYMEKVYDRVYKPLDENKVDFFEIGLINPFLNFFFLSDWVLNSCRGFVESDGWNTLKNYPDDFKVGCVVDLI